LTTAFEDIQDHAMQIYPAIDLRGGQCVRLRQGDYAQETVFGDDPAAMARRWVEQGATYLHLVDLDGAKEGRPVNGPSVRAIVAAAKVPCQVGGGLRTEADIREVLGWGVSRVIVGTKALTSPTWLDEMTAKFPNRIVLGIDAKNGQVATQGWLDVSTTSALDLAKRFDELPLAGLVYTDIARDGMMQGVNAAAMTEMVQATKLPVIASGGVTTIDDIRILRAIPVAGAIVGRALYEGRLDLREITVAAS
jgi:phosphoribosylformimino-5-aminoimidazole carboxamide ribotide isomerase